jgi:hypothetical protein
VASVDDIGRQGVWNEGLVVPVRRQLIAVARIDDVVVAGEVNRVEGAEPGQERTVRDDAAPSLAGERGADQAEGRVHAQKDQLEEVVRDVLDYRWPWQDVSLPRHSLGLAVAPSSPAARQGVPGKLLCGD